VALTRRFTTKKEKELNLPKQSSLNSKTKKPVKLRRLSKNTTTLSNPLALNNPNKFK